MTNQEQISLFYMNKQSQHKTEINLCSVDRFFGVTILLGSRCQMLQTSVYSKSKMAEKF